MEPIQSRKDEINWRSIRFDGMNAAKLALPKKVEIELVTESAV